MAGPSVAIVVINGIVTVADSVFDWLSVREQAEIYSDQAAIAQAELEANTTAGIPNSVFIAVVSVAGLLILVGIIAASRR